MGNLLTLNQATFEGSPHLWQIFDGTLALSTAQAAEGVQSLAVTSNSITAISLLSGADTTAGLPGMTPVTVGAVYSAMVEGRAATAGAALDLRLQWFSGVANPLTFISQAFSSAPSDTTSGWTQAAMTGTAPAGATYARVAVILATGAAALTHYIDKAGLLTGSTTTWEAPFSGPVAGDLIIARG